MGGSSSTRNITLVNDESSGVIKISDSVVKRLRGEAEQANKKLEANKSGSLSPLKDARPRHDSGGLTSRRPQSNYDDFRSRTVHPNQEHEEEVRKLEAHWRGKVSEAEEQNILMQNQMANEFTTTVGKVDKLFPLHPCNPVCQDKQQKVEQCYASNVKTSLQCSREVREFSECVQQARMGTLLRG